MKYNIIYADPPWRYGDKGCNGAANKHYSTMSISDIAALPVNDIAADNCALFLWGTYPLVQDAMNVIKSWGFTYKTIAFQWVKVYPKSGKFVFGLGRWTRGNTEPCFLAIKGKPQRISSSISQLIIEPPGRHSEKPPIVRDKIINLVGDLPRVELFARQQTPGWDVWGNEVNGITLPRIG